MQVVELDNCPPLCPVSLYIRLELGAEIKSSSAKRLRPGSTEIQAEVLSSMSVGPSELAFAVVRMFVNSHP